MTERRVVWPGGLCWVAAATEGIPDVGDPGTGRSRGSGYNAMTPQRLDRKLFGLGQKR